MFNIEISSLRKQFLTLKNFIYLLSVFICIQFLDEFIESFGVQLNGGIWHYLFDVFQILIIGIFIFVFLNSLEKYAGNSYITDSFLRTVVDNMDEGVAVCDISGNIVFLNEVMPQQLPTFPIPYEKWTLYWELYTVNGKTKIALEDFPLIKALKGEEVNQQYIVKPTGRSPQYLSINGRQIKSKSGEVIGALIVLHDITEQKKSEEKIKYMAYHDTLTGLPNLRFFKDKLAVSLTEANRDNDSNMLSVMFLDLDGFKNVNDQFGHDVGDLLLIEVSRRIRSCLRESDIVTRIGGDEFTILLPLVKMKQDAILVADRIIKEVGAPYEIEGRMIHVTISIGIAFAPKDGTTRSTLMKNADLAMYRAKECGKNQYCIFYDSLLISNETGES